MLYAVLLYLNRDAIVLHGIFSSRKKAADSMNSEIQRAGEGWIGTIKQLHLDVPKDDWLAG